MMKRILITATALVAAVSFVGSTVAFAAPMADEATPAATPAKKKPKKKKYKATKSGAVKAPKPAVPGEGG